MVSGDCRCLIGGAMATLRGNPARLIRVVHRTLLPMNAEGERAARGLPKHSSGRREGYVCAWHA